MIGKFLFFLSVVTASFLGLSADAATTSQNVDVIVTPSSPSTPTFTFVNDTGKTLSAGSPVTFGQAFRYGDIMPGTYPLIRDAATHVALPGQQWDELSTWRENGGNGSWRHAVWAIRLPNDLAAGASYQVEFIPTPGTYSQTSHQPLSALCSGPAAHDLKVDMTDVRNQNDTVRDSGHATFRLCDNIANTGRDAPRHLRAGNVYDEYEIRGIPVYAGTGHADPLLYEQCIVDIFTKADGVSPGDVRWICHQINAWMNVAAGSTGNAGNPGQAGWPNDPQAISYRPQVLDGASVVMDWSSLDATIASASNPVVPSGTNACAYADFCMNVPSSIGPNAWYMGQAVRVSCTATCLGGLANGTIYYVFPASVPGTHDVTQTQTIALAPIPKSDNGPYSLINSQGTGSTSFAFRVQSYHWEAWQTLDWTGQDNWSPVGTTTRVTRKVYPALTAPEKRYWQESGLIVPINLAQPSTSIGASPTYGAGLNYEPMGRLNVIGFLGPGPRPDLGIAGEFAAQALINGKEADWDMAREFSLGSSMHGLAVMVNEATGRIPAINNGPPNGPGGNGNGGSYPQLGAPMNQIQFLTGTQLNGMVDVPHNQPNPAYDISGGTFNYGTYVSHHPNFNGFTYMLFGSRHFLDMMRWNGNADYGQQRPGPGSDLGQGYYRDNNAIGPDGKIYHYYGLLIDCCQTRGSSWMIRDIMYPATFGSDNDIERSYFHDFIQETSNYYPLWETAKNGPGNTNYSSSILPPNNVGTSTPVGLFEMAYVQTAAWIMRAWLHEPLGDLWEGKFQRYFEGTCGGQLPGALAPYYCIGDGVNPATVNGDPGTTVGAPRYVWGTNIGQYFNGVDAKEFGTVASNLVIMAGGVLAQNNFRLTAGDTLKMLTSWWPGIGADPIDQLPGNQWFEIMNPDNNQLNVTGYVTYTVRCPIGHAVDKTCPVPGQAFTGWTRGGVDISGTRNADGPKLRPQFDPGPNTGFADPNYVQHGGQMIYGLHVLGYKVDHAMAAFDRQGGSGYFQSSQPQFWWDPTIVVQGLPPAHNGL